jgi:hypothetical protein
MPDFRKASMPDRNPTVAPEVLDFGCQDVIFRFPLWQINAKGWSSNLVLAF